MKVVESLIIDLSLQEHIDKHILMAYDDGYYFVWIQDDKYIVSPEEIKSSVNPIRSHNVAKELFDLYISFMVGNDDLQVLE